MKVFLDNSKYSSAVRLENILSLQQEVCFLLQRKLVLLTDLSIFSFVRLQYTWIEVVGNEYLFVTSNNHVRVQLETQS